MTTPIEEKQATHCGCCGEYRNTPWRDSTHGYVCLPCLAQGFAEREQAESALAAQTEKAEAERDELRSKLNRECSNHDVTRDVLLEAERRESTLTAELDAARKERDNAEAEIADWKTSLFKVSSERDTAQARCAELERELHERKWAQGHVIEHGKEIGCGLPDLPPYTSPEIRPATSADNEALGLSEQKPAQEQGEAREWNPHGLPDMTQFRFLCIGEQFQNGDEFWNPGAKKWLESWNHHMPNHPTLSENDFTYRRRISPPTPGAKQSEEGGQ